MTEQKKHAPPIPEDSPILASRVFGHELKHPVVMVWDPFGENWRGLWRAHTGRPTKAWLEDKATEPEQITEWHQLRLRSEPAEEVESGQRIGQEGMTGTTTGDYPHLRTSIFGARGGFGPSRASAPSAEPATNRDHDKASCNCGTCIAIRRRP